MNEHEAKRGLRMSNCVGIVDSSYRGEAMAVLGALAKDVPL